MSAEVELQMLEGSEFQSVTRHMGSHSVTCHLILVNVPHFYTS